MKKIKNKGFTFIELVIYMGILSIFMLAVTTLITSTVASNKKMNARKRLQTEATETYDSISDMLMGATEVKIYGTAYVGVTSAGVTTYNKVADGCFVVPDSGEVKEAGSGKLKLSGGVGPRQEGFVLDAGYSTVSNCYDIADIKSFTDSSTPSTDVETFIDVTYLYIKYASDIDASGNTIYTSCTLQFDKSNQELRVYRYRSDTTPYDVTMAESFVQNNGTDNILCKNVSNFQLQVNAETGSFAIILELDDDLTSASYDMAGVVSLRNSYVLKEHSWTN